MLSQKKVKRGVQQLSDVQKFEAICRVERGETKAAVAREYRVPESTLRGWCKKAKLNSNRFVSPVQNEMIYRDCSYSKGSGSDEGSVHPFSEQEDEENDFIHHKKVMKPLDHQILWNWLNRHQNNSCIYKTEDGFHNSLTLQPQQGWFYSLCKNGSNTNLSVSPPLYERSEEENSYSEDEPLALVVQSKRRILEDSLHNRINKMCRLQNEDVHSDIIKNSVGTNTSSTTVTVEEALKHGEVFLNWLQESSDPNVSVLQAMQIATLIKNIRSSHQRNQNKNTIYDLATNE